MPDASTEKVSEECPLKGLYLTRVYREEPFRVVSDMPKAEAVAICSKFAPQRHCGKKGDQEAYMEGRIETENWLRESAASVGVDIRKQNPVYFYLTAEPPETTLPDGKKTISFPAEDFDLSCCSFTHGDSMGNHTAKLPEGVEPHPLQNAVLNAAQTAQAIKSFGINGDYINGGRYIEVQVWADPREAAGLTAATTPVTSAPARALNSSSTL